MIGARVGARMLDKAVYGREPARTPETMSVEELEARLRVMQERARLARWGGRALGLAGGVFGSLKIVALL